LLPLIDPFQRRTVDRVIDHQLTVEVAVNFPSSSCARREWLAACSMRKNLLFRGRVDSEIGKEVG